MSSLTDITNGKGDPPEAPRRRGRPKVRSEERRRTIIREAYRAFLELGFGGTTTEIVAARARISKRTLYELFADKMQLFGAVILEHRPLLLALPRPADEDLPVLESLMKIFLLEMDHQADREREALLNLILRETVAYPELSDFLYEQGIIRMREDLIEWLRTQNARGAIRIDDPALCAGMLMDIAFGALLPRRRQQGDEARDSRKNDVRRRFEIFLRGVA